MRPEVGPAPACENLRRSRERRNCERSATPKEGFSEQKITTVTGWHNHHILWRTHGGKDTIENRVLVHPNCHQQIHSQGLDVGKRKKPPPMNGKR